MTIRMPKGLAYQGQKLWKAITADFDLTGEPGKIRILEDACKLADSIDAMEKALVGQPMVVKGSYQQPVTHPLVTSIQSARALMSQLIAKLALPPTDEEQAEKREHISRVRREAINQRYARKGSLKVVDNRGVEA
jgi:hypothetical protein